ncbi:MAG: PrsW family intramembrane metalloprotease [Ignavibacterium sp.]|nr:MAG: PrsW family intramembrane metalloprotease [Ignavibacterium sp.]
MFYIASALAAIIPMVTYLFVIWKFDRYDREPFKLVLQNYLWGSVGAIILAVLGSFVISSILSLFISEEGKLNLLDSFITAPVVEEITKGLFLFITVRHKKFDNVTDGIVYGGAIGLGFGMTENFLYFISFGTSITNWITIVFVRTIFSAVMHCVATATLGAILGYAKFKGMSNRLIFPTAGLSIAILIHFSWNYSVSFQSTALLGFLFMALTIVIFITIYSAAVIGEGKIIFNELLSEVEAGTIPSSHLYHLSSASRNSKGWIDEKIRKAYVRASTTLAFRKNQLKNSQGASRKFYEDEVNNYREFIKNLIA